MSGGVAAVLTRVAELRSFVGSAPFTTSRTTATGTTSTATAFAAALDVATTPAAAAPVGGASAAAAPATGGSAGEPTGDALVAAATAYVGVPYVWGGEQLSEGGLDCSGLVQLALADVGVTGVPRTAREQMTLGTEVGSLDDARPGDLVVLGGGSHIGIYVGEGKMIDSPRPGRSVSVREVYEEPTTIRRLLPSGGTSTVDATAQARALAGLAGVTS